MKPRPEPGQPSWDWCDEVWRGRSGGDSRRPKPSWERSLVSSVSTRTPDERAALDSELALEQLLAALPQPTVSSNLAARVLAEVARESSAMGSARNHRWSWSFPRLWARFGPRSFAWGLGLSVLLVAAVLQSSVHNRRLMAREVAEMGAVTAIPGVDVLRNFDAISALSAGVQVHPTDVDLMAAMVAMGN